ncbi:MAG: hypothetical protein MHM6MM_000315 [Cercozoa sp. M6MM]
MPKEDLPPRNEQQQQQNRKERDAPERVLRAHGQDPRPQAHKAGMEKHGKHRITDRKSDKSTQKRQIVREQVDAERS